MITPEAKEKIFKADLANIVRKVKAGRPLTNPERKILSDAAAQGKTYAETDTELAKAIGCDRRTIFNARKKPGHPKKTAKGYDVQACRDWYLASGILTDKALLAGDSGKTVEADITRRKLKAEARKEEARATLLSARANREIGKALPVDGVCDQITEAWLEGVARFRAVGETIEHLAGETIGKQARAAIDDALAQMAKLPWISDDVKKKMLGHGSNFTQPLPESFAHPQALEASTGFAETLLSTQATIAPAPSESPIIQGPPYSSISLASAEPVPRPSLPLPS